MRTTGMLVAALALAGCATQFTGAPKVQNGPAGCKATCDGWGMELAGMVKMGEYSDGCICQQRASQAEASTPSDGAGAPSADRSGAEPGSAMGSAAVTGVYLQMQAVAAAAAAQQAAAASAASRHADQ